MVGSDGSIYRAVQATTNVNPVGDTSGKWERIVSQSDITSMETDIQTAMTNASNAVSNASAAQSAVSTLDANVVKLSGDQAIGGVKTFSSGIVTSVQSGMLRNTNTSELRLMGGKSLTEGASVVLRGKDASTNPGTFLLRSHDGTIYKDLLGKPDGTLTWNSKEFVYTSGSQTVAGEKTFSDTITAKSGISDVSIKASGNAGWVRIGGGSDGTVATGAVLALCGINSGTGNAGRFKIFASDGANNKALLGDPSGTLTWNGQPVQTTSDERLKTPLADVPDTVLDAWGDVGWGQFQYLDAVEAKGADKARLHLGLVAQRVKAVFEARGLDACAYGILCHEEYPATDEEPAVDIWMVRYTEAQAMEAAYQRRRADRAEARISVLERRLNEMEAVLASLISPVGEETYAEYAEPEQEQDAEQEGEE